MDDKLIRLARKVKTLEDELSHLSQIKDLEGLLFVNTDITNKYKKAINETVNIYKDYISNTEKELTNSIQTIKKEHREKTVADTKQIQLLETKIAQIKEDIQKVCTSIDKSIEDIQKDILKDIKDKNNQILLNLDKKDKELKEVKQENIGLVKDLKALKDLVNKLELQKGDDGKSAYDIACELGFKGTKEEWIKSLHGKDGQDIELRGLRAFSDAPKDNKMYARKNKKWVEVENYDDTEIREDIEELQEENETQAEQITTLQTENTRLKATLPTTTGSGENITLQNTAELEFIQPPIPRGNSKQVQYSGKNKASINTYDYANGRIIVIPTPTLPIGTYTISFKVDSFVNASNSGNIAINCGGVDTSVVTFANMVAGQTFSKTITTTAEATQFSLRIGQTVYDAGDRAVLSNIQLEQGSTATAYEPYVGGTASPNPSYPQPITNVTGDVEVVVQNKNLLQITEENVLVHCSYVSGANTEQFKSLCTASDMYINEVSSTGTSYDKSRNGNLITCKYGETIYFDIGNLLFTKNYFTEFDENLVSLGYYDKIISNGTYTPRNSNCKYITLRFGYGANAVAGTTYTLAPIICKISDTSYTPHKEQTYTFPLGNQRMYLGDYLADDGIHHVRKQVVLDGSESDWRLFFSTQGLFVSSDLTNASSNLGTNNGLSNRFTCTTRNYMRQNLETVNNRFSVSANELIIANKAITSVADFKTWLSTHNVTVEYKLATEEITPYTTEQQQAYDEIKQAISYEEQTNISGSSDESNPILSVEAYQSIKLILAS